MKIFAYIYHRIVYSYMMASIVLNYFFLWILHLFVPSDSLESEMMRIEKKVDKRNPGCPDAAMGKLLFSLFWLPMFVIVLEIGNHIFKTMPKNPWVLEVAFLAVYFMAIWRVGNFTREQTEGYYRMIAEKSWWNRTLWNLFAWVSPWVLIFIAFHVL